MAMSKTVSALKYLRLKPFDTTTPEGRGSERLRLLSLATLSGGLSKIGSILIVIATVHWGAGYLGVERFGLWMTITSIIALLSFTDLGVSNSLINFVSAQSGKDDSSAIRQSISNGLIILVFVALVLGVLFVSASIFVDWSSVFNVKEPGSIVESGPSVAVYAVVFLVSLPVSVVHKVQVGLQEGWRSNLWLLAGQLSALIALILATYFEKGVPVLVFAVAGVPTLVSVINYWHFFYRMRKDLKPTLGDINRSVMVRFGHVGVLFLLLQFMSLIGSSSDQIIISNMLGAASVSAFSVTQKLTMIFGVAQLFIAPMWPTLGEAISRGDHDWARKAFKKVLILSSAIGLLSGFIVLVFGRGIINLWAGPSMLPSNSTIYGFAAYSVLMSVGGSVSVYLNNGIYLRKQAVVYTLASIISIGLKVGLISYLGDASGAIWGTIIGYSFFFIVPAFFIIYLNGANQS